MEKQVFSAEWLYTPAGWKSDLELVVDETGLIEEVRPRSPEKTCLKGALIPGWVNAHTHLELSHLKGLIPPDFGMAEFASYVIVLRNGMPPGDQQVFCLRAAQEAWQQGTQLFGDISNQPEITTLIDLTAQGVPARITFHEQLGAASKGLELRNYDASPALSPAPHAPYSVSDRLCQVISRECERLQRPVSIHLLESEQEVEFQRERKGPIAELFAEWGVNLDSQYKSGVDYVIGNLSPNLKLMVVHMVEATKDDFSRLMAHFPQLSVCTCPRSNLYIHEKLPDYSLWKQLGFRICIGTDSLASGPNLDLWNEILCIHNVSSCFSTFDLIQMATTNGAEALGKEQEFGLFRPGTRPGVLWLQSMPDQRISQLSTVKRLI